MRCPSLVLILAAGCSLHNNPELRDTEELQLTADLERAPPASARLSAPDDVDTRIDSYFEGQGHQRLHVQLDRPLYKPGDDVWVKTWSVASRGLQPSPHGQITYELVNPRGQVVGTRLVQQQGGTATNDFTLDPDAPGGRWTLRASLPSGDVDERPFVVSSYTAPRIRKKLEFVREAYGPGDRVDALLELEGTRGPLANHEVRAMLQVAGETVLEETVVTDDSGAVLVSAQLPERLESSDGLLTLLVEDGGVTESISRSVPIVLADLQLAWFPEGGDLVAGLPARVYFQGTNAHGEPADVSGTISDDRGNRVASFGSVHDGLGRVAFTPEKGRLYTAHITEPVGVTAAYALPESTDRGCTLRSFDDFASAEREVRVAVRCTSTREVLVTGVLSETAVDAAAVRAGPSSDAVVYLDPGDELADRQGAVRVTVFDRERVPLAERLVYRNHGRDLRIEVTPDRERYGPRDEVVLAVRASDPSGEPIAAELALSVVDDTVISLADDEEGHMLSRLYLEPELVESPEDPAWYFDDEEELAARGVDLVLGTLGWRRFDWAPVWNPPVPETVTAAADGVEWKDGAEVEGDHERIRERRPAEPPPPPVAVAGPEEPMADAQPEPEPVEVVAGGKRAELRADRRGPHKVVAQDIAGMDIALADEEILAGEMLEEIGYFAGDRDQAFGRRGRAAQAFAPVRVFPKPDYRGGFSGTRRDFRDTVHWEPTVQTGEDGTAEVRFTLSDAVTAFRVTTEGMAGGYAGHSEVTFASVLPISVSTKLPAAVSAGDELVVPVSVANTRDEALRVGVSSMFEGTSLTARDTNGSLSIAPGASGTHWIPVSIGAGSETATVRLVAEGGGLSDSVERELRVVPSGFPRSWSAAGESEATTELAFQLDDVVPHSLTASVSWHPSSVSTLISGMEGLIRSPGGCFEQTSSTNWPNVAILSYLEAHDGDPRLRVKSSRALDVGYAKLTGYQVDAGGFETWGSGPGKEALSAFGLLQFADMQKVYPVTEDILSKDAAYLLKQRNGRGGFENTGESAHGYGSAPADVLDGFITYALVTTGHGDDLERELDHQAKVAGTSDDPYVLALAARSLLIEGRPEGKRGIERLAELQAEDGSFPGAASSITRSYEANLLVESTALSALALMEAGTHRTAADRAAGWLIDNRQGAGTWGATQATALALSALTTHAEVSKVPRTGGELSIEVNGRSMGTLVYTAEQSEPLVLQGWADALKPGHNDIALTHAGGEPLPFTVEVAWTAIEPTSAPGAELALQTELSERKAGMGETVRLTATVDNRTDRIVPSPIARIGLPAGLEAQTWQLKQLQDRGQVAFFETRPREVTLYWDGIKPSEQHEVHLDLVASGPGRFTGPASSAYPYYNDDEKAWAPGLEVAVARP